MTTLRTSPLDAPRSVPGAPSAGLRAEWAQSEAEVQEAQRLRHQVFAVEGGARLDGPEAARGLDVDRFDAFCDHLLVRGVGGADDGTVVGTYRVLSPERARAAGGCYTETEFDLTRLRPLLAKAVELGRSCVHGRWRTGGVVLAMWSALAQFMVRRDLHTMIGCASIGLAAGVVPAIDLCDELRRTHKAEAPWEVRPLRPLPSAGRRDPGPAAVASDVPHDVPPLLKGYLRCGARVLGAPAFDDAFNTADLPLMMRLDDMAPRYRRHLLERQ